MAPATNARRANLTFDEAIAIRKRAAEGASVPLLEQEFGAPAGRIRAVLAGVSFREGPRAAPASPRRKPLTFVQAEEIRDRAAAGASAAQLRREFPASERQIQAVLDGVSFMTASKWPRQRMLESLRAFYDEHGAIRWTDLTKANGLPPSPFVQRVFGSFEDALREIGIPVQPHERNRRRWTDEAILEALQQRWAVHGRITQQIVHTDTQLPAYGLLRDRWGTLDKLGITLAQVT